MALDDKDLKILTGTDDSEILYQSMKEVKQGMTDEGLDLEHSLPELIGDKKEGHNIPKSLPLEVVDGSSMKGPSRSVVDKEDLVSKKSSPVPKGKKKNIAAPNKKSPGRPPKEVIKDIAPKKASSVVSKEVTEVGIIKSEMSPLEGEDVKKIDKVPPPVVKITLADRTIPPTAKVVEEASKDLNDLLDEVVTIPLPKSVTAMLQGDKGSSVERPVKVSVYNLIDNSEDFYTNPNENYLSHYHVSGDWFTSKFDSNLARFITQMSFGRYIVGPVGLMRKLGVRLAGEMRPLYGYRCEGLIYLTVCAELQGKPLDPKEAILIIVENSYEGV